MNTEYSSTLTVILDFFQSQKVNEVSEMNRSEDIIMKATLISSRPVLFVNVQACNIYQL